MNKNIKYSRRYQQKCKEWLRNYKSDKCCQICGYKEHPEILVFHHLVPLKRKIKDYAHARSFFGAHHSIKRMEEKAKECLLLCPNCHALLHITKRYGYR
jgi:hypothetical protein